MPNKKRGKVVSTISKEVSQIKTKFKKGKRIVLGEDEPIDKEHVAITDEFDRNRFRDISVRQENSNLALVFGGLVTIILGFFVFNDSSILAIVLIIFGGYLFYYGIKLIYQINRLRNRRTKGIDPTKKQMRDLGMEDYYENAI
jgi:uncharacterized membrane protein